VATGGGGYQWARVVPRAWTIYFAQMAEREVGDDIPLDWIELAARESGLAVPDTLSEAAPPASDDRQVIGRVVEEARRAGARP